MELKVKFLKWSAGVPVAMLNPKTASKMGIHSGDRVAIRTLKKKPREISIIVGTIENVVNQKQIILSSETIRRMGIRSGEKVDVNLAPTPKSLTYIKQKLKGKQFTKDQIEEILMDLVNNSLSESEVALFISAMYTKGMNFKETVYLIDSMLDSGERLSFKNKFVVDKHCVGGIPGNRTTPIVVSICASAGLTMPKNSSRAITSAAGTADVIETLAKVEFSREKLKKIVSKTGASLVWEGPVGTVPSDSKIIKIEKMLKIDPEAQLLASIMSKKLAVGSKFILIDIPFGKGAKFGKVSAESLKEKFEKLGRHYKKKMRIVLTKGEQPIGKGIGPVFEMKDVLDVLDSEKIGPEDLESKAIFLAGQILEMTGKAKRKKGEEMARGILKSGKAFEKFKEIIKAQGGSIKELVPGKYKKEILAVREGTIKEIQNKKIASLAREAGCPLDKAAGIYLEVKLGKKVKKKDKLLTIHAESKTRLKRALTYYRKEKPIKII